MTGNLWPDELKILIVDDEQETLNLMRLSLEPAGFRILRTTNPEEGLELALQEKPDLLLLDIMMPGIDGFEVLRRVRCHPKLNQVPVIIISARVRTTDHLRMLKLSRTNEDDIDAYLGKPFDPAILLRTVKDVLVKHKDYLIEKHKSLEKSWEAGHAAYH
jgi:two-component system alkaline phosphatase synthesis response regulator PhoP